MANTIYQKFKERILGAGPAPDIANVAVDIKVAFVDNSIYVPDPSPTGDEFLADIPLADQVILSSPLLLKTLLGGVFDADDLAVGPVPGGPAFDYMVIYLDTGDQATSPLICYFDTAGGLPFVPSGNNVLCVWNAAGIFSL